MEYEEWKNGIKPEKRERTYQHVDDSLNLDDEKIFQKVVSVIKDIKNHQFLPFIRRNETIIRFRNKNGVTTRAPKVRPIMYASHIDAHIYSYYNFLLSKKYETYLEEVNLSENVIAYRKVKVPATEKGKSNIHFAKEVFEYIKSQNDCVVVTHDIEGFFDNIDHSILKDAICKVINVERLDDSFYKVLKSLTKYKYIRYADFNTKQIKKKIKRNNDPIYKTLEGFFFENKTNKGIPQGSPISGLLANVYLIDFDHEIKLAFPNIFYRRYSDDLIFVCKDEEKEALRNFVDERIKKSKLNINSGKSFISTFRKKVSDIVCESVTDGLGNGLNRTYVDYLGLEFDGQNILLRKNTIQKLKMRQYKKVEKQVRNTFRQKRRKPRKTKTDNLSRRNNYLRKAVQVISESAIGKQVLKFSRKRNNIRKEALASVKDSTTQIP